MESIWFGNAYEYRSAFFHDVMYSNNAPFKEGALLFKNPNKALQIALLYQRYDKFDTSSYSLSNATFFNIFGTETLRIGRYKRPLTDDIVLCVTDPLTFSEIKRYLNSFNILKWFKSRFLQQKRKRQYLMRINDSRSFEFLTDCIFNIEYGRIAKAVSKQDAILCVPILPVDEKKLPFVEWGNSRACEITGPGTFVSDNDVGLPNRCGLAFQGRPLFVVGMETANSQYFLENLFESIFVHLKSNLNVSLAKISLLAGNSILLSYCYLVVL